MIKQKEEFEFKPVGEEVIEEEVIEEEHYTIAERIDTIENMLDDAQKKFFQGKRRIYENSKRSEVFSKFMEDLRTNMKRFIHEYDMSFIEYEPRFHIKAELEPLFQEYIICISRFLCERGGGLKPARTIQGKNAEAVFMSAVNCFLHYFRVDAELKFNRKSFRYGGDGGSDFCLGKYRFDVKHRDDGPGSGLFLRESYLDRAEEDVILVLTTNATNIKLGSKFNTDSLELEFDQIANYLRDQHFPLALVGWITIKEYKQKKQQKGSYGRGDARYVVDDLHGIESLFVKIMEDQLESERLFY